MPSYIKRISFNKNIKGFTIIELLIAISVIGAIATVSIRAINQAKQQEYAEDASKIANLEKACSSIQTFFELENGLYPGASTDKNPLNGADAAGLSLYLSTWPEDFSYNYDASSNEFSVHVNNAKSTFYKCGSLFKGITECAADTNPDSVSECNFIEGGLGANIAHCPNGTCDIGENAGNCPQDCEAPNPDPNPDPPPVPDECTNSSECTCTRGIPQCNTTVSPNVCECLSTCGNGTCDTDDEFFGCGPQECPQTCTEETDQKNVDAFSGPFPGSFYQSFTAGMTGTLTKVDIKVGNTPANGNLYIREGSGTTGAVLATNTDGFNGSGTWQTFIFDTPANVNQNSIYTIHFTSQTNYFFSGNLYAGGTLNGLPNYDGGFRTYVLPVSCSQQDECGDGQCTGSETLSTCPEDCSVCGDLQCTGSETNITCPKDCPAATEQKDQQNTEAYNGFTYALTQTFTAGISGDLTKIDIKVGSTPSSGILYIRNGAGSTGAILASNADGFSGINGWQTFVFDPPAPVTAEQVYTIHYSIHGNYYYNNNVYLRGNLNGRSEDIGFVTYVLN